MIRKMQTRLKRILAAMLAGGVMLQAAGCPGAAPQDDFLAVEIETVLRDVIFFALDTTFVEAAR